MEFALSADHRRIQGVCRELAAQFAPRARKHDEEASSPNEDYAAMRDAGVFGVITPKEFGGWGSGYLGYTIAAEELAQGSAATAMSFNMHCVTMGVLTNVAPLSRATKQRIADLVIKEGKLFCALLSEPGTAGYVYSTRACSTQVERRNGGYSLTGKKAWGSMIDASDYVSLFAHPADCDNPETVVPVIFPRGEPGQRIEEVWNTLGMRATRSDNLILEDCFVPDEAVLRELTIPSIPDFLRANEHLINLPYIAVYLGVGVAALKAAIENVQQRRPKGYRQPLAYHPAIRRRIAVMSAELEAARWLLRYAAWLMDTDLYGPETLPACLKAKYVVGEAVAAATRSALELGGGHAIFKGSTIERLFRDGATATIMQPHSDVCLTELSVHALQLDREQIASPLLPE